MALRPADAATRRYGSREAYQAACDAVDDALEEAGYLEPTGRRLLHAVEDELWDRAVLGAPAPQATPQEPLHF